MPSHAFSCSPTVHSVTDCELELAFLLDRLSFTSRANPPPVWNAPGRADRGRRALITSRGRKPRRGAVCTCPKPSMTMDGRLQTR